jgi:glycosyltransferase involved in cell wall biosynthesis
VTAFTVLLPVYAGDDARQLRRSFESVTVAQTFRPAEVVVVRDGPVGAELASELDRLGGASDVPVLVVPLEDNVGLARALDAGLAASTHEIVARQDADDVSRPRRFEVQVPLVASGLDIVGSAIEEFHDDASLLAGGSGLVRTPPLSAAEIDRAARFRSPFNHPSVVYRRSAVVAAGGYEDLPLMEDYWLFARMLAGGARALNVPEPLVLYRVGAGAYTRRGGAQLLRSELELQRRLHGIGFTTTLQEIRNSLLRGGYRLVPETLRRGAYRADARRR